MALDTEEVKGFLYTYSIFYIYTYRKTFLYNLNTLNLNLRNTKALYLTSFLPLLLITKVWEAGTMPVRYKKCLPKLYFMKENSTLGATALPLMEKVNVGPSFT